MGNNGEIILALCGVHEAGSDDANEDHEVPVACHWPWSRTASWLFAEQYMIYGPIVKALDVSTRVE